jgi:hypothetical protein
VSSDSCQLRTEEERILASFIQRLIEIAAVAGAGGSATSATSALNAMRLPAIALDQRGFVVSVNTAANAIFDSDVNMKDKRLFVRNLEARTLLKASLDNLTGPIKSKIFDCRAYHRPTPRQIAGHFTHLAL